MHCESTSQLLVCAFVCMGLHKHENTSKSYFSVGNWAQKKDNEKGCFENVILKA